LQGVQGIQGVQGLTGEQGLIGLTGEQGLQGLQGVQGIQGIPGIPGLSGSFSSADFFALMPGDNNATIAPGADLSFPQDGPSFGPDIVRLNASTFSLLTIGVYQVMFQVSITESGQLCVVINAGQNPATVVGRATGTSQLVGICLIRTTLPSTILSIRNPLGEPIALTVTTTAGGTNPVSAHLVITRLN
jgi:hypothetical protein